jgi:hypothetical protein
VALTLINKPLGHKLTGVEVDASIVDSAGDAAVYTGTAHGLSDGDYVYIQSDFDSYNGFKYVDSIAYDYFKIKDSENGDYVQFVQNADIEYQVSVLEHGFVAVHQPIVYEIESDISPTNVAEESYTPTTVVSQSDESGYTRLSLSVGIADPTELAKIELVGSGDLAGVYQIVNVYNAWDIVIDLAYDASNDYTGYMVVKYYDNYTINVNVIAGLQPQNRWYDQKPFELAATLKFTPDSNNRIKFSISEVLRSYIQNVNNLTLDTLPNNINFIVSFYIEYYETYDVSDGEDITTHTEPLTTDDLIGHAINAKLEFKNESISHMSDYVNNTPYTGEWLTLFERPLALVGKFFDLSFINQYNETDIIIEVNGATYLTIENPGIGVIRVPLEIESGTEELCVQAITLGTPESGGVTSAITLPALSTWTTRSTSASLYNWTTGANPTVNLPGNYPTIPLVIAESETVYTDYAFVLNNEYTIIITFSWINNTAPSGTHTARLSIMDVSFTELEFNTSDYITPVNGSTTISLTFTAGATHSRIGFAYRSSSDVIIDVIARSGTQTTPYIPEVPSQTLTEVICIDVIEECESTYIETDVRLLEDGDYRLLE